MALKSGAGEDGKGEEVTTSTQSSPSSRSSPSAPPARLTKCHSAKGLVLW